MTAGCWPFVPDRCPSCMYFLGYEPERLDDAGQRRPGWCRHRRVVMELVVSEPLSDHEGEDCEMFIPSRSALGVGGGLEPAT